MTNFVHRVETWPTRSDSSVSSVTLEAALPLVSFHWALAVKILWCDWLVATFLQWIQIWQLRSCFSSLLSSIKTQCLSLYEYFVPSVTLFNFLSLLYLSLRHFSVHKVITSVTCMTWRSSHGWLTTTWRYRRRRKLWFSGTVIAVVIYSSTCTSGLSECLLPKYNYRFEICGMWAFTVYRGGHLVRWQSVNKTKQETIWNFIMNVIFK